MLLSEPHFTLSSLALTATLLQVRVCALPRCAGRNTTEMQIYFQVVSSQYGQLPVAVSR